MKARQMVIGALFAVAPLQAFAQDRHEWRQHREWRGGWGEHHDWGDHRDWGGHPWWGNRYPAFGYPAGWGYRRWAIGAFLPPVFLGGGYWFNDYYRFGFAPPPYGFRWVRNGPDLLLVNVRNGHIRDVRYGVFG